MQANAPDWSGRTVVCIGAGPSLTPADCALVRNSGHWALVINTSFRLAPWAHALYAADRKWWEVHHAEVARDFRGERYAYNALAAQYGAQALDKAPWFGSYGNSGAAAIALALAAGAVRIVLLGYDCSLAAGSHWHGDHPAGLSNCASIKRWPAQFRSVAYDAHRRGVPVLNASRNTALACFERVTLESAL